MIKIIHGNALDVLRTLENESVNSCITSPPYWGLRDYQIEGQIGLEKTPEEYISKLVDIFMEVKRILRNDGTLWLILGDTYCGSHGNRNDACTEEKWKRGGHLSKSPRPQSFINNMEGLKPKDIIGIPWMTAFALRADGWYLRQDIIWSKPNPMPESVKDRCTKAHEYIFLLSKNEKYYYDAEAIREPAKNWGTRDRSNMRGGTTDPKLKHHGLEDCNSEETGRNKRSVWNIATAPYSSAHFATFPPKLIEPCILAGCPIGGTVLDPFGGSGTTAMVAECNKRNSILIELNPEYIEMAKQRTENLDEKYCEITKKKFIKIKNDEAIKKLFL